MLTTGLKSLNKFILEATTLLYLTWLDSPGVWVFQLNENSAELPNKEEERRLQTGGKLSARVTAERPISALLRFHTITHSRVITTTKLPGVNL